MRRAIVLACLLAWPHVAAADDNDIVLGRLSTRLDDGSFVAQNLEFRALSSQLGVVLAPHLLTPADTLGFGGFELAFDYATTTIDPNASYWRVRQGAPDPSGTGGGVEAPGLLHTTGMFVRKGMWFPLPSFEIGAGAVHLDNSRIWAGQLYAKFGLHEGYHDLPIPSLSVRGGVSRMFNQRELDLTIASLDIEVSKHFGIGGTWRFDPFAGWNLLMIVPRAEVVDATPDIDPLDPAHAADSMANFVFKNQQNIYRNRFFAGAKAQYYWFYVTLEVELALAGSSTDDRSGTSDACMPNSMTTSCDAKDIAGSQRTISLSAGFDL